MAKLTFKKEKVPGGLIGMVTARSTIIKLDGQGVGRIQEASYSSKYTGWKVGLMIEKIDPANPNNTWKWIFFKKSFEKEDEARAWIKNNWSGILRAYKLHPEADY